MNPVNFVPMRRSSLVGRAPWRGFGFVLGLVLLLSGCRGCSYHSHSEWHTGTGSTQGSGGEVARQPEERERSTRSTRRPPAGRDNVVRVTGDGNKTHGGQGGGGSVPERTVVRPSGDVPPSSRQPGESARGESDRGAPGDGSPGAVAGEPAQNPPAHAPEPAADAPAEREPEDGKPSLKSPSEPHVTTPTQRKPRKVHRDGATNKEGRRE